VRLVFAGTPAAALPTLRALAASRHELAAVVTRPDAPVGRGKKMQRSPVAELAEELELEALKPIRPNEGWFLDRLRAIAPDCCPVTAYGALLPQSALDIPPEGWVNLHFSVLPAWRGAAPVQHAVLRGDDITGATTFRIVKELDAGPVFGTLTEPIRPTDTSGDLLARLAISGAELLVKTLDAIEDGTVLAVPQPADGLSFAPKLTPADARVDWKLPAHLIDRQVRACTPDPGAWTEFGTGRPAVGRPDVGQSAAGGSDTGGSNTGGSNTSAPDAGGSDTGRSNTSGPDAGGSDTGRSNTSGPDAGGSDTGRSDAGRLKLWPVTLAAGAALISAAGKATDGAALAPGELRVDRNAVYVGTGTIPVRLGDVQPQGKRRMPAADWARGLRSDSATTLGLA
jgi:methionyl-tRNA formyltransferase